MSVCIQCLMPKLSGRFWLYAEKEDRGKKCYICEQLSLTIFLLQQILRLHFKSLCWNCLNKFHFWPFWLSIFVRWFWFKFMKGKRWKKRNRKKTSLKEAVTQAKVCLAAAIADASDRFHTKQTFWKIQSFRSLFLRVWVSLFFLLFR